MGGEHIPGPPARQRKRGAHVIAGWRWLLRRISEPAGVYIAASVLSRSGAIVLIPIFTRELSVEDYGVYTLALTLMAFLPTLLSLGLSSAVARFYFDGESPAASVSRVGGVARWLVIVVLGLSAVIQILIWYAPFESVLFSKWEVSCIIWASAGSAIGSVPSAFLRSEQRAVFASVLNIGRLVSSVVGGIFFVVVLHRGLKGAIESCAFAALIDSAIAIAFILIRLPGPVSKELLREALRFSLPFVPHFSANQIGQMGDRWLLKVFHLDRELGGYGLATQIVSPATSVVSAWNEAASPVMGEKYRDEHIAGMAKDLRHVEKTYVLAALLPVIGVVAALPLISRLVSASFGSLLWLVPLVGLTVVIDALYYPNVNVLFYANRVSWIPIITITASVLNIIANLLLIPALGVIGAVLARAISGSARSGGAWWVARRVIRTHIQEIYAKS